MNIVYVGDNRHRGNFGCRATSTALSQIISKNNKIVGRVYGDYTNHDMGDLFYCKYYPSFVYKAVARSKHQELIRKFFYYFHRILKRGNYHFSRYDFISYNLDKSIKNLLKCLPANPCLKDFDLRQYDYDALVVNGEGSFIFAEKPWRECLIEAMLMHWALKMGKKVYFMNGMLSDDPYSKHNEKTIELVRGIFNNAELIGVRENYSLDYAKKYFPESNILLFPDALFSWYELVNDCHEIKEGKYYIGMSGATDGSFSNFDFSHDYILIAGSSSIYDSVKGDMNIAINTYMKLVEEAKKAYRNKKVYLIQVCEGDAFLNEVAKRTGVDIVPMDTPILAAAKILANSKLFISGRYHPAILASLGGTPCVFMASNSHKTRSIQELLGYKHIKEFSENPSDKEISEIIEMGKKYMIEGNKMRQAIKERCKELSSKTQKQGDFIR